MSYKIELTEVNSGKSTSITLEEAIYYGATGELKIKYTTENYDPDTNSNALIGDIKDFTCTGASSAGKISQDGFNYLYCTGLTQDSSYTLQFTVVLYAYRDSMKPEPDYVSEQSVGINIQLPGVGFYSGLGAISINYGNSNRNITFNISRDMMWYIHNGSIDGKLDVTFDGEVYPLFTIESFESENNNIINPDYPGINTESTNSFGPIYLSKLISNEGFLKYQQWYVNLKLEIRSNTKALISQNEKRALTKFERNFVIWVKNLNTGEWEKGKNFFVNDNKWTEMDNVFDLH